MYKYVNKQKKTNYCVEPLILQILEDKEQLNSIIQRSRESRVEVIDQREAKLISNEKKRMRLFTEQVKTDEHFRNRSRIAEIWIYVDRIQEFIKEEEEKLEPVAH